ncbi:PfkB family carbohydrate kinase [Nocardia puris]|uniref:RfaE bifunctional protein nucleotidyltransferase chain/domain n=1 Tax=Nocardia puris TaxID=208602 RepID=A0A366D763_9NOCA|nr:PfkB family carbohydrate kinase [Nocardia puris]RBO85294.1 rfaE bifunctional protein nucleotidyltransferase chain/domain [Nocardia puris]
MKTDTPLSSTPDRVAALITALESLDLARVSDWGSEIVARTRRGGRLLVLGNGGSAAQAQHLVAELVVRFETDRAPLPAIALCADSAVTTAAGNDLGFEEVFARQVRAHARPGDILLVLSTSGRSPNVVAAVAAAQDLGVSTWALTGPAGSPVSQMCDEVITVPAALTATVQECHLAIAHILCEAVDKSSAPVLAASDQGPTPVNLGGEPALASPAGARRRPRRPGGGHLVVVGDVLADCDWVGEVTRVSPEAPVPVLSAPTRQWRAGGAGMAAVLAAEDGWTVTLIAAWPADKVASRIQGLLRAAGVRLVELGTGGPMPVKVRLRAGGQTLLMVDDTCAATPISAPGPQAAAALVDADGVLVADYGRGVVAMPAVRELLAAAVGRVPVVWDPHPAGAAPIPGASVCTPNAAEAAWFTGAPVRAGDLDAVLGQARELRTAFACQHVLVSRGAGGAVLVGPDETAPQVIPAPRRVHGDSCGAGDRLAVALLGGLIRRQIPSAAARDAVAAATAFVAGHRGPLPGPRRPRTVDALAIAEQVRARGGRVVATGGCFDVLHAGHLTLLESAAAMGDCLIVLLNSDTSVARLKGPARPLISAPDRAAMLSALGCVDAVIVFDEDTPEAAIAALRPDVWVKGGDYVGAELPERAVVEAGGGLVVTGPYRDGVSTSELIARAAAGRAVRS